MHRTFLVRCKDYIGHVSERCAPLSSQRLRTENRLLKQRIETLEKVRDGLWFLSLSFKTGFIQQGWDEKAGPLREITLFKSVLVKCRYQKIQWAQIHKLIFCSCFCSQCFFLLCVYVCLWVWLTESEPVLFASAKTPRYQETVFNYLFDETLQVPLVCISISVSVDCSSRNPVSAFILNFRLDFLGVFPLTCPSVFHFLFISFFSAFSVVSLAVL